MFNPYQQQLFLDNHYVVHALNFQHSLIKGQKIVFVKHYFHEQLLSSMSQSIFSLAAWPLIRHCLSQMHANKLKKPILNLDIQNGHVNKPIML
jgi:hypothetical protein